MANLEDIVRKRRSSLAVGDRRHFSVARVEAVRKMRKFALEDPRYYLLELIQSAVANGTGFISIDLFRVETDSDELKMRWTGDGFSRMEMLNLFDVLLEAEGEGGRADIQMFARAINAMLIFEPRRLLIASGGRGRSGVTCEVRKDGSEIIELRNTSDFDGVHIFASGMKNARLPQKRDKDERLYYVEKELIRERCSMPKVQVMFNGREVSHITWTLHDRVVHAEDVFHIEEDDLHGEIWPTPGNKESYFDLMTYGVKIDRVRNDLGPFRGVSGAVVFNKLRKTADHAKIVRDENYDRLWARLRPYAEMLQGRRDEIGFDVSKLDAGGDPIRPDELLELLETTDRVLMVTPDVETRQDLRGEAGEVADALGAEPLLADASQDDLVRLLAGEDVEVVRTDLSRSEIRFFTSDPLGAPPRPWLVEATEPRSIPVDDFVEDLIHAAGLSPEAEETVRSTLGTSGYVDFRVYTPEALGDGDESLDRRWVRILACERQAFAGGIETAFPGHLLYVDLPPATPAKLEQTVTMAVGAEKTIGELVAEHAVREARDELERATSRALDALGRTAVPPGSHASRIALHALGRQTVLSLSPRDAQMTFAMLASEPDRSLLGVPLFEDFGGQAVDGARVEALLEAGVLRVVRPGADVDLVGQSVEPDSVLVVDAEQERLLINIVGGDALERLDADVDVSAPTGSSVDSLLETLRIDDDDWLAQERRRRSRRRLLAHLVESWRDGGLSDARTLADVPLVETADGGWTSMRQVFGVVDANGAIIMSDGRSIDVVPGLDDATEVRSPPLELRMNPYLAHLLRPLGVVKGLEDATVVDAAEDGRTAARIAVESSRFRGFLAVPERRLSRPVISVVDRVSGDVHALRKEARRFGVVGTLGVDVEEDTGFSIEEARQQIEEHARLLLEDQMGRMSEGDDHERRRRLEVLLAYAGQFVRLSEDEQGCVDFEVIDDLAMRILELPLFPTTRGVPVSAVRFLREFARSQTVDDPLFLQLPDDAPEPVREWVDRHLDADVIYRETHEPPRAIAVDDRAETFEQLASLLGELGFARHTDGEVELRRWPQDRDWLAHLYGFNRGVAHQLDARRRVFVWVEGKDTSAVALVTDHPLLERLERLDPRERLSWLALSVYSCINEARVEVRNEHELAFHRALAERLMAVDADQDIEDVPGGGA